jgi:hypothetical protein
MTYRHIWHYKDLQSRKESRDKAWTISGWAETVSKVRFCLPVGRTRSIHP